MKLMKRAEREVKIQHREGEDEKRGGGLNEGQRDE